MQKIERVPGVLSKMLPHFSAHTMHFSCCKIELIQCERIPKQSEQSAKNIKVRMAIAPNGAPIRSQNVKISRIQNQDQRTNFIETEKVQQIFNVFELQPPPPFLQEARREGGRKVTRRKLISCSKLSLRGGNIPSLSLSPLPPSSRNSFPFLSNPIPPHPPDLYSTAPLPLQPPCMILPTQQTTNHHSHHHPHHHPLPHFLTMYQRMSGICQPRTDP